MSTLIRNATLSLSRRGRHGRYEQFRPLNQQDPEKRHVKRVMSITSVSYRRRRAKQRRIFLGTYRLSSMEKLEMTDGSCWYRAWVKKVKKLVASMVSSLRSSNCKKSISAASPTQMVKCC